MKNKPMFTKKEVGLIRQLWGFINSLEPWKYNELVNKIENMSSFYGCVDDLLHFMENNQE